MNALSRNGLVLCGIAGIITMSAAAGDDICWTAPRCWQYHREVCFGHYQTRWRQWDEACGRVSVPAESISMAPVNSPSRRPERQAVAFRTPTAPIPAARTQRNEKALTDRSTDTVHTAERSVPPIGAGLILDGTTAVDSSMKTR